MQLRPKTQYTTVGAAKSRTGRLLTPYYRIYVRFRVWNTSSPRGSLVILTAHYSKYSKYINTALFCI
jgi:hypothetical protein